MQVPGGDSPPVIGSLAALRRDIFSQCEYWISGKLSVV